MACTKYKDNFQRIKEKNLTEGAILSRLRYALELISSGSDKNVKRLESMQSKAARYVLKRSKKELSRSGGNEELQWLTIPQISNYSKFWRPPPLTHIEFFLLIFWMN